jgi:hypothetical protein
MQGDYNRLILETKCTTCQGGGRATEYEHVPIAGLRLLCKNMAKRQHIQGFS